MPHLTQASGTSRQPQLPPEQSASLAAHAPSAPGGEEAVASRSAGAQGQAPAASARGLEGIAAWSSVRDNPLLEDAGGERGPGDVVGPSAGVPTAHEAASGAADDYEADLVEPPSNRDVRRSFIQMPDYWAEAEAAGRIPAGACIPAEISKQPSESFQQLLTPQPCASQVVRTSTLCPRAAWRTRCHSPRSPPPNSQSLP